MNGTNLRKTVWRAVAVLVAANAAIGYALLENPAIIPLAVLAAALVFLLALVVGDMGVQADTSEEQGA